MKIKSLLVVSIISFFCTVVFAEDAVTGICKDGTPYTGKSKRGACRGHDGVKEWYGESGAPAANAATQAPAPAATQTAPAAVNTATATGLCKDGTPYTGQSKRGACRGHDGLKEWYADKPAATANAPAPAPAAATTAQNQPAQQTQTKAVTGICKDGTEYTGTSKRGACRGHDGVKEWFADKQQAPAANSAPVQTQPAPVQAQPVPPAAQMPAPAPVQTQPAPAQVAAPIANKVAPAPGQIAAPVTQAVTQPAAPAPVAGSGQVWVNTHSKIYHCEGSKFYGKTKKGEFMSEADAQAKGYVANRKKICNK